MVIVWTQSGEHNGRSLGMRLLPTVTYKYMRMSNVTKNLCNVYVGGIIIG